MKRFRHSKSMIYLYIATLILSFFVVTEKSVIVDCIVQDSHINDIFNSIKVTKGRNRKIQFFYKTNGYDIEPNYSIIKTNNTNPEQIYVRLSPHSWSTPFGLRENDYEMYWLQPENHRNFPTAKRIFTIEDIYGLVEVHHNAKIQNIRSCSGNETHYINFQEGTIFPCDKPQYDTVVVLPPCYDTEYFQHFLDNGTPQIALMHLATNFNPKKTAIVLRGWKTEIIPLLLKRYGFKEIIIFKEEISARNLIVPVVHPFVHPIFTEDFIKQIKLNHSMKADKVILISRTSSDGAKSTRQIINQNELEEALRLEFGENFVVFKPSKAKPEEAISLFERAAIMIGAHGGGLYHSYWARPGSALIEIMPETPDGRYHGQSSFDSGTAISHRCFHTNARGLGQKFFRYVVYSDTANFRVNVTDFMEWFSEAIAQFA